MLSSRRVQTRRLVSLSLSFFLYLCMLPIIPSAPARAKSAGPKEIVHFQDQGPHQLNIPVIPGQSQFWQRLLIALTASRLRIF
jgi:hypothetical protein